MRYGRRLAAATAVSVVLAGSLAWAAQGRTLKVRVNYTGGGEVDATHAIHLSIWDTADFASGALPFDTRVVTENGGSASFTNVSTSPAYVTALYDEQGGWDQLSAVPSGTPAGVYSTAGFGGPAAIEVGSDLEISMSFDDGFRIP